MALKYTTSNQAPQGSLDQDRRAQLLDDIFKNLAIADESGRSKVLSSIERIATNFERRAHEADQVGRAPNLAPSRDKLITAAVIYDKAAELTDPDEPFEILYGIATDNPFADPQIHEREREKERQKHLERVKKQRVLKKLLNEAAADCRERAGHPGWRTGGGGYTTHTMAQGTPVSRLFTDCCPLFEDFQPGKISYTSEGRFSIVAACIYEIVTGQEPECAGISLEHHVRTAVKLYRKNSGQS